MRILYLSADPGVPVLGPKGASVHLRALARGFVELGCDVVIASPRIEPGDNALPTGVSLVEIPAVRPRQYTTDDEVRAYAERQASAVTALATEMGAAAIYERFSLASFAGARAARALGVPLLLEVNAPLRAEEERFRQLRHPEFALDAEREELSAALRIVAVSTALVDWLATEGVERSRVELMPNAFPLETITRRRPVGAGDDLVIGFAGGLKLWHGVDVLLEGFELALQSGAALRLEVAGAGPAADLVEAAALPAERFDWLGHLPHEAALARLGSWDVGAAPFIDVEGFWFSPLKIFEYMAAGLAVVASELGDIPALLDAGAAGRLVAPGDPDALAQALVELADDRASVRALGERAALKARAGPTWSDNARRVLALLGDRAAA